MKVKDPLNILTEDILSLGQAAKEVPRPRGHKPTHYATIHRWTRNGLRGHKLETVKVGQQSITSRQRLAAFLKATQHDAVSCDRCGQTGLAIDKVTKSVAEQSRQDREAKAVIAEAEQARRHDGPILEDPTPATTQGCTHDNC